MKPIENAQKFAKHINEVNNAVTKSIPAWVYEEDTQKGIIGNKNLPEIMEEAFRKIFPKGKSFLVSKVFRHRGKNCVPQFHNNNFENWLVKKAAGRVIPINKAKGKLSEYVLPDHMNGSAIQKAAKSTFMEEDQFFATLYLLIIEPQLGKQVLDYELSKDKWYIFHVRLRSGKDVDVYVCCDAGEWDLRAANGFNYYAWWSDNSVFLYPAAA